MSIVVIPRKRIKLKLSRRRAYLEEWRAIPNYEGFYEVSDLGRVRSLDRVVVYRTGLVVRYVGKILRQANIAAKNSRMVVDLKRCGTSKQCTVANLVLLAFEGPRPPGHQCCHWNDVGSDNRRCNLRWGTALDNARDRVRNGGQVRGEDTHNSKLTEMDVREIMRLRGLGVSGPVLAKKFGVTSHLVYLVEQGKAWAHVGVYFKTRVDYFGLQRSRVKQNLHIVWAAIDDARGVINLAQASRLVGMSRCRLCTYFKKEFGVGFKQRTVEVSGVISRHYRRLLADGD